MKQLLKEIRNCQVCLPNLELGTNPVLSASIESKVAIIGQAPGQLVHKSGVPWDDKSGDRLRAWLGVNKELFYNTHIFALIPMGFCYPGKGKTGDLPPRKECAPLWHEALFDNMPNIELTVLIGSYAQNYYLQDSKYETLTETVMNFSDFYPNILPLPHPSPRNNIWLKKNMWFERDLIPILKDRIQSIQASN